MMAEAWPPSVGARVRPVETAQVAFSPEGEPVPLPGEGPAWARLRYPLPSDGDDRLEALVADVEEGDAGSGGNAITSHARASLVWNDGSEQDDVSLASLGPCVDERERSDAEAADVAADVVVPRNENENENAVVESARRAAAASDARGAFRFRRGDFAAAAAEYVEACASLLSAVPRKHARVLLPGDEKDWNLPPPHRVVGASFDAFDDDAPFFFDAIVAKPRVAVGARVRVLGDDGFARLAVVACVDSDDETCDVLFDETTLEWEEEEEEDAVAFSRLRGASLVFRGEGDDETKKQSEKNRATLETVVSVELADALLNVARCHSRLASASLGGNEAAAAAAAAAASASLSLRKSPTALFLRGKALASSRRFEAASRDLETAARLASACARRGEEATRTDTLATTPTPEGLEGFRAEPASLAADVAAIRAALRATRAAAKEKNRADRRLAAAILGHVHAEGVDLGLDPESDLAKTGVSRGVVGRKEKDGSVPIGEAARVVAERVAGKRCVVS